MEKIKLLCNGSELGVYDLKVGIVFDAYFNDDCGHYEILDEGFSYELIEIKRDPLTFYCKSFSGGLVSFIQVN